MTTPDNPAYDQIADDKDTLDWDREAFGPMRKYASEEEPETVAYNPEEE